MAKQNPQAKVSSPPPLSSTEVLNTLGMRDAGEFSAKIVTFTPEMSKRIVQGQLGNRFVRRDLVLRYADVIGRGEWVLNGETIKFDKNGGLLDGQHRLLGCAAAGKSFKSLVAYGVARAAIDTIDVGSRRTVSDILSMQGEIATMSLGAILTLVWRHRNGHLGMRGWASRPEPHVLLGMIKEEPEIRDAAKIAAMIRNHLSVRTSVTGAAYHLFRKVSKREADHFIHIMKTGEGRAS